MDDTWLKKTVEQDREKWKDLVRLEAWHQELLDDGKGKNSKGLISDKRGMQRKRPRRGQRGATEVEREKLESKTRETEHIVPAPPYGNALGLSVGCHDKVGIAESSERGTDNVLPGKRLSQDNVHQQRGMDDVLLGSEQATWLGLLQPRLDSGAEVTGATKQRHRMENKRRRRSK